MAKVKLKANCEDIWATVKEAHLELIVEEEEIANMSDEEIKDLLEDKGELKADYIDIEDYGLGDIEREKVD